MCLILLPLEKNVIVRDPTLMIRSTQDVSHQGTDRSKPVEPNVYNSVVLIINEGKCFIGLILFLHIPDESKYSKKVNQKFLRGTVIIRIKNFPLFTYGFLNLLNRAREFTNYLLFSSSYRGITNKNQRFRTTKGEGSLYR